MAGCSTGKRHPSSNAVVDNPIRKIRAVAVLLALLVAVPAAATGLTTQVQQRRDAELRALQLQLQQRQLTGPTVELRPWRKLEVEQWQRDQRTQQLQLQQRQQREQTVQPAHQLFRPPQLRPTPEETARQDEFRRERDIQRLQRQPPPSR